MVKMDTLHISLLVLSVMLGLLALIGFARDCPECECPNCPVCPTCPDVTCPDVSCPACPDCDCDCDCPECDKCPGDKTASSQISTITVNDNKNIESYQGSCKFRCPSDAVKCEYTLKYYGRERSGTLEPNQRLAAGGLPDGSECLLEVIK